MINSGIYMIVNELKGKSYIGSSVNVYKRWSNHKYLLKKGKHHNIKLQNSWNKYKEINFKWAFIEPVIDINILLKREQSWINIFNPSLNIVRKIQENTKRHRREEGKVKMAEFMRGNQYAKGKSNTVTQEVKDRISAKLKGTRHSEESYEKMAATNFGKKHTEEAINNMVLAQRKRIDRGENVKNKEIATSSLIHRKGEDINTVKLNPDKVIEIRKLYSEGKSGCELAKLFGVNDCTIYHVVHRRSWKHI